MPNQITAFGFLITHDIPITPPPPETQQCRTSQTQYHDLHLYFPNKICDDKTHDSLLSVFHV